MKALILESLFAFTNYVRWSNKRYCLSLQTLSCVHDISLLAARLL